MFTNVSITAKSDRGGVREYERRWSYRLGVSGSAVLGLRSQAEIEAWIAVVPTARSSAMMFIKWCARPLTRASRSRRFSLRQAGHVAADRPLLARSRPV